MIRNHFSTSEPRIPLSCWYWQSLQSCGSGNCGITFNVLFDLLQNKTFEEAHFPKIYFWEIHCTDAVMGSRWILIQPKTYTWLICLFCVLFQQTLHDRVLSSFCTFEVFLLLFFYLNHGIAGIVFAPFFPPAAISDQPFSSLLINFPSFDFLGFSFFYFCCCLLNLQAIPPAFLIKLVYVPLVCFF